MTVIEMSSLLPAPTSFEGFCPIPPVPKGRPRFTRNGIAYTPEPTRRYEESVRKWLINEYGSSRVPMDGSIDATLEFVLERPKSTPKSKWFADRKPDADNLDKSFLDACDFKMKADDGMQLGVLANDSRISSIKTVKRYAEEGEQSGTRFSFKAADSRIFIFLDGFDLDIASALDPTMRMIPYRELSKLKKNATVRIAYLGSSGASVRLTPRQIRDICSLFPNLETFCVL